MPFLVSFVLLLLVAALTAAKAWVIQPVVDAFIGGGATIADLRLLCLIAAGIFLGQASLNWLYGVVAAVTTGRLVRRIREDLFAHLSCQSLSYFSARPSADLTSRVANDVAAFEHAAVHSVQLLFRDLVTILMLMGVLFYKDWPLATACLVVAVLAGWILRVRSGRIERLGRQTQEMVSGLNHQLAEMIGGFELILGFGLGAEWRRRYRQVATRHYEKAVGASRAGETANVLVLVVVALGLSGILYLVGRALLSGRISAGDFGTFLAAMYLMQTPAVTIGMSVAQISKGLAAAGRAFELLEEEPEIVEPTTPRRLPAGDLGIEFASVTFAYGQSAELLSDLSFAVAPGELVAMVGDSGAGKSTVARLLMRFYDPQRGEVRLGGVALHDLAREELYGAVSYVAQEVFLFDGTVEFNLRIGRPKATEEELAEAIRLACLEDLIAELPDGLETRVGERGVRLSGGQRQRIALARSLLTEARVLLFDEATSALDMELEQRILQNLADSTRNRTIFAITHRLTLADIVDRVLVLKSGRLVEQGPADELAGVGGEFARLQRASRARLVRKPSPLTRAQGFQR